MQRSLFQLLFVAALASAPLASSTLSPGVAHAQEPDDRERAHAEFSRGVEAFQAADYATALDAFQEAYRLAPHPAVRVNIANCYDRLGRPLEALFHFEHYLSEAERLTAAQRREVEGSIERLSQQVGSLTFQVTPDGARITIDGADQRRAPVVEPVRVTAGTHVVEVQLEGYAPERQTVDVQGGRTARVALRLRRAEAAIAATSTTTTSTTGASTTGTTTTATETEAEATTEVATTEPVAEPVVEVPAEEPPREGGGLRMTTPVWIAGGITAALLVGWAITGPLALVANSDFDAQVARSNDLSLSEAERQEAGDQARATAGTARALAITSDVLLVATALGAGATVFFFIIAQTEEDGREDTASLQLAPIVSPTSAGIFAHGSF